MIMIYMNIGINLEKNGDRSVSLVLRRATLEDCEILYEWRNDELVRKNSFCQEYIEQEEHIKWLRNFLDDKLCRIYILID